VAGLEFLLDGIEAAIAKQGVLPLFRPYSTE